MLTTVTRTKYLSDLQEKEFTEEELRKPSQAEIDECTELTAIAFGLKTVEGKKTIGSKITDNSTSEPKYILYKPTSQSGHNSEIKERIVMIQDAPVDPLAPNTFKRRKMPGAPPSPPTTVLRSPPRKATKEEIEQWKIPSAISNWTNPRGYVVALDKRIAMDGHMMEDFRPSEKFAQIAEALSLAEEAGRLEIEERNKIRRKLEEKEREQKQIELRKNAMEARLATLERAALDENDSSSLENRRARDALRQEREAEIRRNMHRVKRERDISETVALNQPVTASSTSLYDERLFHGGSNRMASENAEQYETNLFSQSGIGGANTLYRPVSEYGKLADANFAESNLQAITGNSSGTSRKPVQFEKDTSTSGEASKQ